MSGKLISDLNSVGTLGLADQMEIDKDVSGVRTSYKTSVKDIVDFANRNVAEEYDSTSSYAVGDYCIYESGLYKCTASTTGSFDNTKWTAVVVTDEMGSGGGGGGGHTIKDDNGTSLTQRANLQFKGVYTHDNSGNSASVVEIARSMTWAEYQLLSADEKKGLITITDRYTTDAMFVNGVFIDTDNLISSGTLSNSGTTSYTATEDCYFIGYSSSGSALAYLVDNVTMIFAPTNQTHSLLLKKGQTITVGEASTYSISYKIYGIQEGTNPSIPDYSTTEHKTGRKWIDGKDIWEKTVYVTTNNTTPQLIASNVANFVGSNGEIDGYQIPAPYLDSNRMYITVIFVAGTNEIKVYSMGNNYNNLSGYITIQYTKTS